VPAFIFGHRLARRFDRLYHASSVRLVVHFWLRSSKPLVFADWHTFEHSCHCFVADTADSEFVMRELPDKSPTSIGAFGQSRAPVAHRVINSGWLYWSLGGMDTTKLFTP
jgi:hypothetical protein